MRIIAAASLLALSLAGCSAAREAAGEFQRFADKGVTVVGGDTPDAAEPVAADRPDKQLPSGLIGDGTNRRYTTDVPATPDSPQR